MEDPSDFRPPSTIELPSKSPLSTDIAASIFATSLFDEQAYRIQVRRIPASLSEKEYDEELHSRALNEGIELPHSINEIEAITSSISDTTVLSESTNMQGSIMSQSTAPTSCSSSERRPVTSNSRVSTTIPPDQQGRPFASDAQKKRNSVFRSRMRRMVGKKRKDSSDSGVETITVDSIGTKSPEPDESQTETTPPKSPVSVRSLKSAWSNQVVPPKVSSDFDRDPAAFKRSMECKEMTDLQKEQHAERDRFLNFRNQLLNQLRHERDDAKGERKVVHDAVMAEKRKADDEAVEELEEEQLQEEMKMAEEHRFWERMMHSRLRNIEKRVQNPTPPPTPGQTGAVAQTPEVTKAADQTILLPIRPAAGPSEYNHLAEQYREQTSLMHSHGGKINVLRGQQQRKMEAFLGQQREQSEALEDKHNSELSVIDEDFNSKEKALSDMFAIKKASLELYWYKQAVLEQHRQERATGLKYHLLPILSVGD